MNVRCYALLSFFLYSVTFGACATEHSSNSVAASVLLVPRPAEQ
jgi:hypothetical protein